jgi:hypothetical protein
MDSNTYTSERRGEKATLPGYLDVKGTLERAMPQAIEVSDPLMHSPRRAFHSEKLPAERDCGRSGTCWPFHTAGGEGRD